MKVCFQIAESSLSFCKDRENINTQQVFFAFFHRIPYFFYALPLFLRIKRKNPLMLQKAPGDSYLLIVIFNIQHSTLNT